MRVAKHNIVDEKIVLNQRSCSDTAKPAVTPPASCFQIAVVQGVCDLAGLNKPAEWKEELRSLGRLCLSDPSV